MIVKVLHKPAVVMPLHHLFEQLLVSWSLFCTARADLYTIREHFCVGKNDVFIVRYVRSPGLQRSPATVERFSGSRCTSVVCLAGPAIWHRSADSAIFVALPFVCCMLIFARSFAGSKASCRKQLAIRHHGVFRPTFVGW